MQVQQQTDIILGGARSVESSSRSNSSVSQNTEKQASAPFKDEVTKQIDHTKAQSRNEKNEDNHNDSDISMSGDKADTTTQTTAESEADTEQKQPLATQQSESADNQQQTEEAINVFASQLDTSILSTTTAIPVAANVTTGLPQGGNSLPASLSTADAVTLQQSSSTKVSAMEQSLLQATLTQADSVKNESIKNTAVIATDAEPLALDAKLFKLGNTVDRQFITNAQFADMMSEQQGSEMLAKASRLQQVPLSTAIASSAQASANMHAVPSAALTDSSAVFNLNSPLAQSLSAAIGSPVQSAAWSQQMTDQVNVMLKGGFQQAEIKLNPAHLGPMEIKLSVNDDKANIHFVAHHAPVRDAIDAAMPRLREMLEQQGLNLADVDVSSQSDQQQAESDTSQSASATGSGGDDSAVESDKLNAVATGSVTMTVDSGINLYA